MKRLRRPRDLEDNYVSRDEAIQMAEALIEALREESVDTFVKLHPGVCYTKWRDVWLTDPPPWAAASPKKG